MSLMSDERIARLGELVDEGWRDDERRWAQHAGPIVLNDAVRTLLARVVCAWCAVPLAEREVEHRTRQLTGREPDRFALIPQGGGDPWRQHRCAGEWITIELMRRCALRLARMDYEVPARNPDVDFQRLPALPANGFPMRVRQGSR